MNRSKIFLLSAFALAWMGSAFALTLDESPAEAGDWGYRPENGASLNLSPPPFSWRPVREAAGYTLEIASDAAFAKVVYTMRKSRWAAHCPDTVLPAGDYFWRYAAHGEDGARTEWSQVRGFAVLPEATAFPKPPAAEILSRIPEGHPRLFMRPEEVTEMKRLAADDLSARWKDLVASADKLLANPPNTAEPPKYTKGMKRLSKEWKKVWWGNRVRAVAVADGAAKLAFVYQLSGERRYGEGARDLLMALCDWDPKGSTQYNYNDEAAMPLLYFPSRAYTWAYDMFSPEERARVVAMMTVRGRDCYDHLRRGTHLWRPYKSHSNRAWHWLGEVSIAFQGEIAEAETWLDYALHIFYVSYPAWGGKDGGWHEGTAYWSSYVGRFLYWAEVSQSALGINPFEKPFYAQAGDYGLYLMPPGTQTGGFGDSAPRMNSGRIAPLMAALAGASGNPYWQWHADQHGVKTAGYSGFLRAARTQGLEGKEPKALPSSKAFSGIGLAALNTNLVDGKNNIQILFKSSPFGRQSHGYNANNAFLLHVDGGRALIRSGKRDVHGSPHHTKWQWHSKSDNTILVNGEGQTMHSPKATGHIADFFTSKTMDYVVGEAAESYPMLRRATRRVFFFKPHVIVIHDLLEAEEASTFQWLLHGEQAFELSDNSARLDLPQGQVAIRFLQPAALTLSQTNTFDTPPHDWATPKLQEWHMRAETTKKAKRQEFISLLTLNDRPMHAALTGKAGQYSLELNGDAIHHSLALGWENFDLGEPPQTPESLGK
jgi:hypothetical protein